MSRTLRNGTFGLGHQVKEGIRDDALFPQYVTPWIVLVRASYRTPYSHFRRPGDILHRRADEQAMRATAVADPRSKRRSHRGASESRHPTKRRSLGGKLRQFGEFRVKDNCDSPFVGPGCLTQVCNWGVTAHFGTLVMIS